MCLQKHAYCVKVTFHPLFASNSAQHWKAVKKGMQSMEWKVFTDTAFTEQPDVHNSHGISFQLETISDRLLRQASLTWALPQDQVKMSPDKWAYPN